MSQTTPRRGPGTEVGERGLGRGALGLAVGLWLVVWLVFVTLWRLGWRTPGTSSGIHMVVALTGSATAVIALLVGSFRLARWRLSGSYRELLIAVAVLVFGGLRVGFGTAAGLFDSPGNAHVAAAVSAAALLVTFAVLIAPGDGEGVPSTTAISLFGLMTVAAVAAVALVPGAAAVFAGTVPAQSRSLSVIVTQGCVACMWLILAHRFTRSAQITGERNDLWCVLMFLGLAQARVAFALAAWFGPTWIVLTGVLRLLAVLLAAVGLHREAQRELVRSQLLAQRLLREQLLRDLADEERRHDVRAALFAIQGTATALETHQDALEPNGVATLARALASEAARLERLVSGGRRQDVESLDVADLLDPLIAFERARGQEVAVSIADGLVAAGRPDEVREVLRNLLDNARLHAPGSPVRVTARPSFDERHVLVTVADSGPGVPAAARQRIFERGERADTAVDGSGLGLYVAAKLAREQDAELWLEEQGDEPGTTCAAFTLCLPAGSGARSGAGVVIRPQFAGPTDMAVAT